MSKYRVSRAFVRLQVPLDEFMELSCGIFLSNLSLVVASFSQAFIQATEYSITWLGTWATFANQ